MAEEDQEMERAYYDDGLAEVQNGNERSDDYDIPTYDELDLEGRYWNYGSREEYNQWRNEQIEFYKRNGYYLRQNNYSTATIICTFIGILIFVAACSYTMFN